MNIQCVGNNIAGGVADSFAHALYMRWFLREVHAACSNRIEYLPLYLGTFYLTQIWGI